MRNKATHRTPDVPRVFPFKHACEESGFKYTTLRDAHFRGDLEVIRVGRSWYITEAELRRFTAAHTVIQARA